jgi:1,2-diacylglycerol 3-alpha-glucosyltransferase
MHVIIAGQTYYPAFNGQSIFTTNLAEGLAQRNHKVLVLTPSGQSPAYYTERHGVQIYGIKSVQFRFLHPDAFYTPFAGKPIRRIFDTFQPDIVHVNDHYPLSHSVLKAARQHGVKVVGTNHFMPENLAPYVPWLVKVRPLLYWVLWRWMLGLFNRLDVATAPSKTAATILRRQGLRGPIYAISCGVNLNYFQPDPNLDRRAWRLRYGLDPERVVFFFVGRVDGEKRLDVLLRALHYMDRDDIQLAVAGKGSARNDLEALAQELNLGQRVHFTGFVPEEDLPALLNSADIFAMPSEAELLSIATLEAMGCGRPVLAARAGALPELVTEGINGYLFQAGDVTDAARYMALLADHPETWQSMGTASLQKVQLHSLDNTIQRYEMIYEVLVAESALPNLQAKLGLGRLFKKRTQQSADQVSQ